VKVRVRRASFLFTIAATGLIPGLPFADTVVAYDSGNDGEKLTALSGDLTKRVVLSVDIGTVNANDILVVDGEAELTNDTSGNASLGAQLILGSTETETSGVELDEANATNITPDIHHGVRVKASIEQFPSGNSRHFVNFVVWSNTNLTVEQDYGRLQIAKISP